MGAINGHYGLLFGAVSGGGGGGGGGGAAVTWNPTDVSASWTLSNLNKTANKSSGGGAHAMGRSTSGRYSGKVYWEEVVDASGGGSAMLGLAMEYDALTDYPGQASQSIGYYSNGDLYRAGGSSNYAPGHTTGSVVGFAWDVDAGRIWISVNGTWIASGNPAANTNPALTGVQKCLMPASSMYNVATQLTLSMTSFAYTPPTGFSAYGGAESYPTVGGWHWNKGDIHTSIAIIYSEQMLSRKLATADWQGSRSATFHNSGKYYAEFADDSGNNLMFGVATATATLSWVGNDVGGWSLQGLSGVDVRAWNNGGYTLNSGGATTRGKRGKVAVDFAAGKIWLGTENLPGLGWFGGGDPGAGTTPTFTFTAGTSLLLAASVYAQNQITLKNQVGDNTLTIPTGFSMWDTAPVSPDVYLDTLGVVPRAALSLKKLISTATVSVRVRRSSDNTEQDIGFVGKVLDTASLLTFVGSGSGYVTTLYDQTGNGQHYVQATAANQPRIVNAGVYDAYLVFDGVNDTMACTSLTLGTPQFGVYTKLTHNITAGFYYFLEGGANYAAFTGDYSMAIFNNRFRMLACNASGSTDYRIHETYDTTGLRMRSFLYNRSISGASEQRSWKAGVESAYDVPGSGEQTGNFGTGVSNLCSRGGVSDWLALSLHTLVLYNTDSYLYRNAIESAIG